MVTNIDRNALLEMIDTEEVQIVDVLAEAKYLDGHLPGALNIPLRPRREHIRCSG